MKTKQESMDLSEYLPVSELIVEEHPILKPKFEVIDIHGHCGTMFFGENYEKLYDTVEFVNKLKKAGVKHLVNLDGASGTELDRMLKKIHPFEDYFFTFGNVDVRKYEEKNFETYVRTTLHESKGKGIKGLKFWKDISLGMMNQKGEYIKIDDPRLKVIWQTATELSLPVLIHIADPVAFSKPIDRYNERFEELGMHPDWAFNAPDLYSFQTLMEMQENLLQDNPNTTFIVAHVGSYSENLKRVSKWLDSYPNMNVDIAERISELGRQPYTSKKFFEKYQDRILFGTDVHPLLQNYPQYYRFLETMDEYFDYSSLATPPQGRWKIYGIGLEDEVLEKIYNKNAKRILGID